MNKRQRGRNRWNPRTHLLPLLLLHPRSPDLPPNRRPSTASLPPAALDTRPRNHRAYAAAHGIRCPTTEAARGAEGIGVAPRRRRGWGAAAAAPGGRVQGCGALAPPPAPPPDLACGAALSRREAERRRGSGKEERCRKGEEISSVCSWLVAVI